MTPLPEPERPDAAGREDIPFDDAALERALSAWSSEVPRFIGKYRILRPLPESGMGQVYEARHPAGRRCAVKVLGDIGPKGDLVHRFEEEASVLAELDHPGIARFNDVDEDDRYGPFLVMDFVDGVEFLEGCARYATERGVVDLIVQVARAMQHAHNHLVLHCDLKPSNILVTSAPELRAVVLDFGIAGRLQSAAAEDGVPHASSSAMGSSTKLAGTQGYIAPERFEGAPATVRSDLYSLGVVLGQALTVVAQRDGSSEDSTFHPSLSHVVRRCLEPDPKQRYESCGDLAQDLRRFLEHRPVAARRGEPLHQLHLLTIRRPYYVFPSLFVLGLTVWFIARIGASSEALAKSNVELIENEKLVTDRGRRLRWQALDLKQTNETLTETVEQLEQTNSELIAQKADLARASGDEAALSGAWRHALKLYDEALALGAAGRIPIQLRVVECLVGLGHLEEARAACDALMALPEEVQGEHRAKILLLHGDRSREAQFGFRFAEHIGAVEEAIALVDDGEADPNSFSEADYHYALAYTAHSLDDALEELALALQEDPKHIAATEMQPAALLFAGHTDEALRSAGEAMRLYPESPSARAAFVGCRLATMEEPNIEEAFDSIALPAKDRAALVNTSKTARFLRASQESAGETLMRSLLGGPGAEPPNVFDMLAKPLEQLRGLRDPGQSGLVSATWRLPARVADQLLPFTIHGLAPMATESRRRILEAAPSLGSSRFVRYIVSQAHRFGENPRAARDLAWAALHDDMGCFIFSEWFMAQHVIVLELQSFDPKIPRLQRAVDLFLADKKALTDLDRRFLLHTARRCGAQFHEEIRLRLERRVP